MAKCSKCTKVVTKKAPGIQCSRCNKWHHAACCSLTSEQLNTLSVTEAADWKCKPCVSQSKHKRISVILPEPEDEEATDRENSPPPAAALETGPRATDKIIQDIYRQLTEMRREIKKDIQRSLVFCCDKIDEYQQMIIKYEEQMKGLENKYKDVSNKYTNLKLKNDLLEQKVTNMEQLQMINKLELCGITKDHDENLSDIVTKISAKLHQNPNDVIKINRKESYAPAAKLRNAAVVMVTLRDGCRDSWLEASKTTTITSADVGKPDGQNIFLREALTPAIASLLWKAKAELKNTNIYKYVWCKRGTVLARKDDNDKIKSIRSEEDVEKLVRDAKG